MNPLVAMLLERVAVALAITAALLALAHYHMNRSVRGGMP